MIAISPKNPPGPIVVRIAGSAPSSAVTVILTEPADTMNSEAQRLGLKNTHFVNASTSYDYIQSDDTHPTYTGATVSVGFFGGTGSGTSAPDYTDAQIVGGKNPVWNQLGHERMGWALSVYNPATP